MAAIDFFTDTKEFRRFVKGWDAAQPLDELLPSFWAVSREIINMIGQSTWNTLKEYHDESPVQEDSDEVKARAVEFVQFALANLMMNQHFVFIAVSRNKTDGDIYKYQLDKIEERYITAAWAAMNNLLAHLDTNALSFPGYTELPSYIERQSLIISSYIEFEKYFGIDNSPWFFTRMVFLIKEVTADDIMPRIGTWDRIKEKPVIVDKVKRALAYKTMFLALDRFDFLSLPATIRSQAGNEGSKTLQSRYSDEQAKQKLADKLLDKAKEYFDDIEMLIKQLTTAGITSPVNPNSEYFGFYQMT